MNEHDFYQKVKNWDFSNIKYVSDTLTNWDMYEELRKSVSRDSRDLDLGTGGGERILNNFPACAEILGTDFSNQMILTDEYAGLCLMYSAVHGNEDKKEMPNPADEEQMVNNFNKMFNE